MRRRNKKEFSFVNALAIALLLFVIAHHLYTKGSPVDPSAASVDIPVYDAETVGNALSLFDH